MHKICNRSGRARTVLAVVLGTLLLLALAIPLGARIKASLLPKHLRPSALEAKYAPQLERLRQLTRDWDVEGARRSRSPDQQASNKGLFSLPEILEAKVQTIPQGWIVVSGRGFTFKRGRGWFSEKPSLESPVVNTCLYEHHDGSTTRVAEYSNVIEDNAGVRRQYTVLFDVAAMPNP